MVAFPHCKINLGLHVVGKRADGFHDIQTCCYPVPRTEALEIIPARETRLHLSGNPVGGDIKENIVLKAYHLLQKDFDLEPVEIYLHKVIPQGAGLGGGSSDGASALKLLNSQFGLNLSREQLMAYALQLGSDCPFFIESRPMMARGRGEILTPIALNLSGFTLAIVKPDVSVSTADAYAHIVPAEPAHDLESLLTGPMGNWKVLLKNDFEETIFMRYPAISEIKTELYDLGARYASMSGSGSAVFGIFDRDFDMTKNFPACDLWQGTL